MAEDSPIVARLTMETGLMVIRMTVVAGPVMASARPMVVRLTWRLASLVVVKAGLMMEKMTTVAQGWASELSRR